TLLSENELAVLLGMSRTPIRAAIAQLETQGFVESSRGRGVFVKDISFREFRDMFELLAAMQLFVLDTAAARGQSFDTAALRRHYERQAAAAEAGDNAAYYESHLDYVAAMLAAGGNAVMLDALDGIRGKYMFKMLSYRKQHAHGLPRPHAACAANARICKALERGDTAAARDVLLELSAAVNRQLTMFDV